VRRFDRIDDAEKLRAAVFRREQLLGSRDPRPSALVRSRNRAHKDSCARRYLTFFWKGLERSVSVVPGCSAMHLDRRQRKRQHWSARKVVKQSHSQTYHTPLRLNSRDIFLVAMFSAALSTNEGDHEASLREERARPPRKKKGRHTLLMRYEYQPPRPLSPMDPTRAERLATTEATRGLTCCVGRPSSRPILLFSSLFPFVHLYLGCPSSWRACFQRIRDVTCPGDAFGILRSGSRACFHTAAKHSHHPGKCRKGACQKCIAQTSHGDT
jgi:hypothetical protein